MEFVEEYEDLEVYQLAQKLSRSIFELSHGFPKEETYSITDQLRRSSRSVGAQIAEAWGHRRYRDSFVSKLTNAGGEINETIHWIDTAFECGYLSEQKATTLKDQYKQLNKMLHSMISKADDFCRNKEEEY